MKLLQSPSPMASDIASSPSFLFSHSKYIAIEEKTCMKRCMIECKYLFLSVYICDVNQMSSVESQVHKSFVVFLSFSVQKRGTSGSVSVYFIFSNIYHAKKDTLGTEHASSEWRGGKRESFFVSKNGFKCAGSFFSVIFLSSTDPCFMFALAMLRKHNLIIFYPFLDIERRLKLRVRNVVSSFIFCFVFTMKNCNFNIVTCSPLSCLCKRVLCNCFFLLFLCKAFIVFQITNKNCSVH